jgi:hypothetical protein
MISQNVDSDGNKWWYKDGVLHRDDDLPAFERSDGSKSWWHNGKRHRDGDRPAVECPNGLKYWYEHGKLHRAGDLPAIEWSDGSKEWYNNDKRHRVGGPALMIHRGPTSWYFEGHWLTEDQHNFIHRMHMKVLERIN